MSGSLYFSSKGLGFLLYIPYWGSNQYRILGDRKSSPNRAPVVVGRDITLITLNQKVVSGEFNAHVRLKRLAVEEDQPFMIRKHEPCISRSEIVPHHEAFLKAFIHVHDRVDIVLRRTGPKLGAEQSDRDGLKLIRNDQLAATRMDFETGVIKPSTANGSAGVEQRSLVEIDFRARLIRDGIALNRMGRREQRHAITTNIGIISRASIEDVRGVDFLGLLERLHKAVVGGAEFALVEIVVNGLAGDRVAKTNLKVLSIVGIALTSRVIERGGSAFLL